MCDIYFNPLKAPKVNTGPVSSYNRPPGWHVSGSTASRLARGSGGSLIKPRRLTDNNALLDKGFMDDSALVQSGNYSSNDTHNTPVTRRLRLSYQDYTQMQFDFSRIHTSLNERLNDFQELIALSEGSEYEAQLERINQLLVPYGYNMLLNHQLRARLKSNKGATASSSSYNSKGTVGKSIFDAWDLMKTVVD